MVRQVTLFPTTMLATGLLLDLTWVIKIKTKCIFEVNHDYLFLEKSLKN